MFLHGAERRLLDLPEGPVNKIAALLHCSSSRLALASSCRALRLAGRRWFACAVVHNGRAGVIDDDDDDALASWLGAHTAPDGSPATLRLTCSADHLPGEKSRVRHRLGQLDVLGGSNADLHLGKLRGMSSLTVLSVSGAWNLHGRWSDLGTLKALQTLRMSGCELKYVPGVLAELPDLVHLSLDGSLEGISDSQTAMSALSKLTRLRILDLSSCGLSEVPDSILQLSALTRLLLESNFSGESPAELHQQLEKLGALTQLRDLNLHASVIGPGDLPAGHELSALTNLTRLAISRNSYKLEEWSQDTALGCVPAFVSSLTALVELHAEYHKIAAGWERLRPLTRLQRLRARGSVLPVVPEALRVLTALTGLELDHASSPVNGPGGGWDHLLALPHLRYLRTDTRPPRPLREALRSRGGNFSWYPCPDA